MLIRPLSSIRDIMEDARPIFTAVDSVFASAEWIQFCESHQYSRAEHLVCRDDEGLILGVLPVFYTWYEGNPRYRPDEALRRTLDLEPERTLFPALVLGSREGNQNAIFLHPDLKPEARRAVLNGLIDAARDRAREQGGISSWYMYLSFDDALELSSAWPAASMHVTEVSLAIELTGGGFETYLERFAKKRRRAIRHERDSFLASGARVVCAPYDEAICRPIAPLLAMMQAKHGMPRPVEWLAKRLQRQAAALGRRGRVLLMYRAEALVGFTILLSNKDRLHVYAVGFDDNTVAAFDYFNMTFYEPIELAADTAYKWLDVGMSATEAKLLRGGRPRPCWSLIELDGSRASSKVAARGNLDRMTELRLLCERYAQVPLSAIEWRLPEEL